MYEVYIDSDGFYLADLSKENQKNVDDSNFILALNSICYFRGNVTLRQLMTSVSKIRNLSNFISQYSNCDVDAFHDRLSSSSAQRTDFDKLAVAWTGLYDDDEKNGEVYCNWDFFGKDKDGISCSFGGNIDDILDKEIEISKAIIVKDHDVIAIRKYSPKLIELLNAIYHEIGFFGNPEQSKEFFENIMEFKVNENAPMDTVMEYLKEVVCIKDRINSIVEEVENYTKEDCKKVIRKWIKENIDCED